MLVSLADELAGEDELGELRRALQRQQRATGKAKARTDDIIAAVYQAARDAALAMGPGHPIKPGPKDKRRNKPEVALIHATDWQYGKRTSDYSMAICEQRIERLVEKSMHLTELQRSHHPVRRCTLLLGGDMVEGLTVFPGQAWEVEAHLFEQLFGVARLEERMVRTLAAYFEQVDVICEYGNHGRIGRRGDVPGSDNIDAMSYRIAMDRCVDLKNVRWQMSSAFYQIAHIGNYHPLLFHGDEIKSFGGNTPAFGILRKVNQWATGVIEPFTDAYFGHFHTPMTVTLANGWRAFGTGSPESENGYAKEFVAAKGRPSQRLHFVDPERGHVTAEYAVWLD